MSHSFDVLAEVEIRDSREEFEFPEPYSVWHAQEGEPWARLFRCDDGYVVSFSEFADFGIPFSGKIWCRPRPQCSSDRLVHLYSNQIVPLVRSREPVLVLHAAAIEWERRVIAFVAPSGRGKSTLAMFLAQNGLEALCDDCVVIAMRDGRYFAEPVPGDIRVRPDNLLLASALPDRWLAQPGLVNGKVALKPTDPGPRELPLAAIFFLGCESPRVEVSECSKAVAAMSLVQNSFLLESRDPTKTAEHFVLATSVANTIACHGLAYPREFAVLHEVQDAIMKIAREIRHG